MARPFLKGIRVLDLSQFLPGPFATQMLVDMGADVVKIEPPKGDPQRGLDPVTNDRGASPYHGLVNAGKRVVAIDLKDETGRERFAALVSAADVMLESYRPGVMERLGLGWRRLREINPMLVHCALSGYGQNGPMRLVGGHDINYVAAAGQLDLTGTVDKPLMAYPMVADYAGAMQAAISMLGALVGRGRTGEGAYLDVSMTDAVLSWQGQALTALRRGNAPARGRSLLTGGAAFYGVYETKDGRHASLGAIETVFWENFCNSVDRPDLIERQSEALPQTALIADVSAIFKAHTLDEWNELLAEVDCCYHPVLDLSEVSAYGQHEARGLIQEQAGLEDDGGMSVLAPYWIDETPPEARSAMIECDAEDVLADWGSV